MGRTTIPAPRSSRAAWLRSSTSTSHPRSRSRTAAVSPPIDPPATRTRGHPIPARSVQKLDGHETKGGVADVLQVVDESSLGGVLQVLGLPDQIVAHDEGAIGESLQPSASLHNCPEVVGDVGVEGASLSGLEEYLP